MSADVLVDSNVLLDVILRDPWWAAWPAEKLERLRNEATLVINPIIYAEVSVGVDTVDDLDAALSGNRLRRDPLPYEAGFMAGKAFGVYRRRGGPRLTLLPDFYIAAHAVVAGLRLLTRDVSHYRTYFPDVEIIAPDEN